MTTTVKFGNIVKINSATYSLNMNWDYVNYLDTGNLTENVIDSVQWINLSKDKLPSRARRMVKYNSILYSTVRPNQRHYGIIKNQPTNFLVSTGFAVIDVDENQADPDFIYFYLTQDSIVEALQNIAEQNVTTYPSITVSSIENLQIKLPPLSIQKKIAGVLKNISDKTSLNMQVNQNLEQQLDALYKSWFVDLLPFDGMVPSSWKYGKLKDVLKQKRDSVKPGLYTNLPYLPIDSIPMNSLALNEVRPNEEALSSLVKFAKNDILIGAMRVYFHRVALAPFDGITRTTCFTLEPYNTNYLSFALLVCNQDTSIEYAQKTSKVSTMPYAIWDGGLGDMALLIPSEDDATRFNELALPLLSKIQSSYFENARLQNLRDILLPKLMSGELDVSELDI